MPTINGMRSEGTPYEGILYAGIMLTDEGPKLIEFNCRFGDPETQVILPRLNTDLVEVIHNTVTKNLEKTAIDLVENTAITVVIASKGYPGTFKKGIELPSFHELDKKDDILIFHSGTAKNDNENLISNGGRVLSITATGHNVQICRQKAYEAVEKINWDEGFFRKDIGKL